MPVERFLDTNILLYSYDLDAGIKREIALTVVESAWLQAGSTARIMMVCEPSIRSPAFEDLSHFHLYEEGLDF